MKSAKITRLKQITFFIALYLFTIKGLYSEPTTPPGLGNVYIGQDKSILETLTDMKEQPDSRSGIRRFVETQKDGRILIVTVEHISGKIVQIALISKTDTPDESPVFSHFRFNETRQRDIISALGKPINFSADVKFIPTAAQGEARNYLHYYLLDGVILSFATQERTSPAKPSFVVKSGNVFIVDPSATYRTKVDTRIADGFFKAIILTDPAFAEKITGLGKLKRLQTSVPFLVPDVTPVKTENNISSSDNYNSGALYEGPKHTLSFLGKNAPFRPYQTAIREIIKKDPEPIFASEYAVIPVYFSSSAHDFYFFNLKDGSINEFPLGTEKSYLKLFVRPDRSLLEARWEEKGLCQQAYYQLDKGEWQRIDSNIAGFAEACENKDTVIAQ